MSEIFFQLLNRIEQEIPSDEFKRWFLPIEFQSLAGNLLIVQVPNIFFKSWIDDRYLSKIKKILTELDGREMEVDIVCESGDSGTVEPDRRQAGRREHPFPDNNAWPTGLMEKYTFENFVVGSSNQLAHAASLAVANRSAAYNPLFLYGGSGLGKTHLMNAIGNHLYNQDKSLKVVYLSSEQFTNELIEALRSERMTGFRQKYRNIDALMIDDIHFIGGKERTQEEFFYTFNSLYEAEKQIILSSDKMPKEIPDLEDRLRSRFEGGLFADITPPDQETKVAILYRKAEEEGISLSTEVGFFLASQNETNIRILEGYLARLGAYSSLTKKPIDLETARRLLGLFIEAEQKQITIELIQKITADYFRLKISDLKSVKKQKMIAAPRQIAMYLARRMTAMSTIDIGQKFGGRDHSTVIHAVKKVESKLEGDHTFGQVVDEIKKSIKSEAQKES